MLRETIFGRWETKIARWETVFEESGTAARRHDEQKNRALPASIRRSLDAEPPRAVEHIPGKAILTAHH